MPDHPEPPFTPDELSVHLWTRWRIRRSPSRLAKLRQFGGGPPYHRDGNEVRYGRRSSDDWARAQLGTAFISTAEEAEHYRASELTPAA